MSIAKRQTMQGDLPFESPPFGYFGGKQRLSSRIVELMPEHMTYCEPYCGSAAVMFRKGINPNDLKPSSYTEIINDLDGRVINFFRVLQNRQQAEELIYRIDHTPFAVDEHRLAKQLLKQSFVDPVTRAWAWFVCVHTSYNSTLHGGFKRTKIGKNDALRYRNKVDLLEQYSTRMRDVLIENVPALECIERWDTPKTLFYVDPPYPGRDHGDYIEGLEQPGFEELIQVLTKCKGVVLLSCYHNDAVPDNWEKFEFPAIVTVKNVGKGKSRDADRTTEVVWRKERANDES